MADDIIIKFNKAMLVSNTDSKVFYQILFGPLKDDITKIPDITSSTFQLFLDCVMGFMPYAYDSTLTIFPVAWKYQVEKSLNDCFNALLSKDLSNFDLNGKHVCEVLNLGTTNDCEKLATEILDILSQNRAFNEFFEDRHYCFLLEPRSLVEILKRVNLDSFGINILLQWGQNYLTKNNMDVCIRVLFDEYGIANFIKVDCFESTKSLFDFAFSPLGWSLFSTNETRAKIKSCMCNNFFESEWKKFKKGETIIEEFSIKHSNRMIKQVKIFKCCLDIETNFCYFYDLISYPEENHFINVELQALGFENQIIIMKSDGVHPFYISFSSKGHNLNLTDIISNQYTNTVRVEYRFEQDCRVLLSNSVVNGSKCKFYFTKNIITKCAIYQEDLDCLNVIQSSIEGIEKSPGRK